MSTLQEIMFKVQSGKALAADYEELAKLSKAQADEQKKAEQTATALIDSIKKAKISPSTLTAILAAEGLIVLPTTATGAEKEIIYTTEVTTKEGRKSNFKIWKGREVNKLTADALGYWKSVKGLGEEDFVAKANETGKAYFETEQGKTWLAKAFAPAA